MDAAALCQEPVKKLYKSYLIPTLIAMASSSMYCLADVYFISKGAGSEGLAALNIAMPLFTLYSAIGLTFGVGGATVISIAEGTRNEEVKNKAFTFSVVAMFMIGIVVSIIGTLAWEPFAYALGSSKELLPRVKEYLIPVNSCAFAFILMYASSILMRADHAPKLAMKATLIGNLSNIVLDFVFVILFQMGLKGAAIATSIAPFLTLLCLVPRFLKKQNTISFVRTFYQPDLGRRILSAGFGSGILEISSGVIIIIFNIVILRYADSMFLAAFAIVTNIAYVCKGLLNGFAQAAQPVISVNYGAGELQRVKDVFFLGLRSAFLFAALVYLLFLIFPQAVAGLFASNDMVLIQTASTGIRYYFSCLVFMAAMTMILYYFQSIERGHISMVLAACKGLVFVVIGMALLMTLFGMEGLWWSVTFAEAGSVLLALYFLRKVDRT